MKSRHFPTTINSIPRPEQVMRYTLVLSKCSRASCEYHRIKSMHGFKPLKDAAKGTRVDA